MGITFYPNWQGQQTLYRNVATQDGSDQRKALDAYVAPAAFAKWLVGALQDTEKEPSAAGLEIYGLLDEVNKPGLVILHGIHTSPQSGLHITVQKRGTQQLGHINVAWKDGLKRYVVDLSGFKWIASVNLSKAIPIVNQFPHFAVDGYDVEQV